MSEKIDEYIQEENQIFEKKASISNEKKILRTICAFANTEGGTVVIGIDKNKVVGVKDSDEIQQRLYNIIKTHLIPVPQIEIREEQIERKKIIVVYVFPLGEGQVCTYEGRTYIRIGSVNHLVEGSQLSQFILQRGILSFEEQFSNAKLTDIDENKVEHYLKLRGTFNEMDLRTTLINLRLAQNNITFRIKNLGLMLFAKKISTFIPQSGVKIVVFKGKDSVDILKYKIIQNTIFDLIQKMIEFIKENTIKEIRIVGTKREEEYVYPLEVIRELVVNALGHRNYFDGNLVQISIFKDRIEISNPAILPPNFDTKDLGSIAIHRNPNLYLHLSFAKYCEGYGTGIPRVRKILEQLNYLPPKFEYIGNWFRVTVYNKEFHKIDEKILDILKEKRMLSASELANTLNRSKVSVIKYLNILIKRKLVEKVGSGKSTRYKLKIR